MIRPVLEERLWPLLYIDADRFRYPAAISGPPINPQHALRLRLIDRNADGLRNGLGGPIVHPWGAAVELSPTGTTRQSPEYFQ